MKLPFRILAFSLVFVTMFCVFSFPAYAASVTGDFVSTPDFWDWLLYNTNGIWSIFGISNPLTGSEGMCTYSDDGHHHSTTASPYKISGGNLVFLCHCDDCGAPFDCDIPFDEAIELLKKGYGAPAGHGLGGTSGGTTGGFGPPDTGDTEATGFVKKVEDELGTTTVGSSGLLLPISVNFEIKGVTDFVSTIGHNFFASGILINQIGSSYVQTILVTPDVAPISGYYKLVGDVNFVQEGGVFDPGLGRSFSCVSGHAINLGSPNYPSKVLFSFSTLGLFELSGSLFFEVTPLSAYNVNTYTANIGGISSRATSFTGDFGILGDNGQLTKVEGDQIFNETTNNYYNPSTGTTSTVTDWTYDYSDRSYHLTMESGDTVTVTYGDENITIQEGDTVYNVYYIVENKVDPGDVGEDGHVHQWGEPTESTPASCTDAGYETFTCSVCGETKTTTSSALGHKWKVKQSVQTKYDENGELLQQGYTIYECERCGEQYKSTDNTGPPAIDPGVSGGDDGGGSIWDSIVEFFKNIASSFASLPDWFGRFSEFLSSAFSYLPEEIILLLTFGVFTVVAIGVWKAVRR